jgi:parallel beta-helix repeat protein
MKHLSFVFLGATLIAIPAQAAFTDISTCSPITQPGDYQVTADLSAAGGGADCIDITASNVSLKLNGHVITGSGVGGFGITVSGAGRLNHVGIEGPGLIKNFVTGIFLTNTDYSQVNRVTASRNTFDGIQGGNSTFLTLGYNIATQNGNFGILLENSTNSAVAFNELNGNGGGGPSTNLTGGLWLTGGSNNQANNNQASGNGNPTGGFNSGIVISSNGNRVYNNSTDGNVGAGIEVDVAAANNQIFSNLSSVGNHGSDLQDDNVNCGTNVWVDNVAFTKSPASCVK